MKTNLSGRLFLCCALLAWSKLWENTVNDCYVKMSTGFPGGSVVKNPPAVQEMRVRSLGREDPLEKEKTTHSSILAWEIPWIEDPGRLQSMGSQIGMTQWLNSNKDEYTGWCWILGRCLKLIFMWRKPAWSASFRHLSRWRAFRTPALDLRWKMWIAHDPVNG